MGQKEINARIKKERIKLYSLAAFPVIAYIIAINVLGWTVMMVVFSLFLFLLYKIVFYSDKEVC